MAPTKDQTNAELASALEDHANTLIDGDRYSHEAEPMIRQAAQRLRTLDDSVPLVPRLVAELRRAATFCADFDTKTSINGLLGDLAKY